MSKMKILRELVTQRMTAAVEEICGLVETAIAEYEEIVSRSKQETEQQRKLAEAVLSNGIQLNLTDILQVLPVKEEQQEWSCSPDQETPCLPHIKEEPEELCTNQLKDVAENIESKEGQQHSYPYILKVFPADTQQELVCEDKSPSEQQERITVNQEAPEAAHVNKDQDTPWNSQNGELTGEDEEEAHQSQSEENRAAVSPASSSAQQMETEDCEGPATQSDNEQIIYSTDSVTEDSDDDWKREPRQQSKLKLKKIINISQPKPECKLVQAKNSPPAKVSQEATKEESSNASETEDSDDEHWKQSRTPQAGQGTSGISAGITKVVTRSPSKVFCQTKKTSLSCSICGKKFVQKAKLSKHMRIHSTDRLLNGSVSTTCEDRLSPRRRRTKEEDSFACSVCNKKFKDKACLGLHMKIHK